MFLVLIDDTRHRFEQFKEAWRFYHNKLKDEPPGDMALCALYEERPLREVADPANKLTGETRDAVIY